MAEESEKTEVIEDALDEPVIYSNLAIVQAMPEEFVLRFGLRRLDDPKKATGAATVYLSLPHAKRLAVAINHQIEEYEKTFGAIPFDMNERLTEEGRMLFEESLENE